MNVSIILPAFNEEANIGSVIDTVLGYMKTCPSVQMFEIIVVDDGSTDKTAKKVHNRMSAHRERVRIIKHKVNAGYGAALRTGFGESIYEWVFYMDSDRQFDIGDFSLFLEYMSKHQSLVFGQYILTGIRAKRKDSLMRWLNAQTYSLALRILFGLKHTDINCAFKLIPKSFLDSIKLSSTGATINAELFYYAKRKKMSIIELPVGHYPRLAGKQTGANIKVIYRAMWSLIQLRIWTMLK